MSQGHGKVTTSDRDRSKEDLRQELQGRLPKGPFEFSADLTFSAAGPLPGDAEAVARFKRAVQRDSRYATASGPWLRVFGMSQNIRSIYDGGKQLLEGGAE